MTWALNFFFKTSPDSLAFYDLEIATPVDGI
jgi:hypothetical protein